MSKSKFVDASYFVAANTHVFWDVDDFPIPCIRSLQSFPENLKNALEFEGFVGDVSLWGYASALTSYKAWCHFRGAGITFVQEAERKITRLNRMLIDMVYWAYENPPRSGEEVILLLIAKDIPDGDTEFVSTIKALKRRNFNVFIVVSDDCPLEEMPIPPNNDYDLIWRWSNLLDGKIPIEIPFESDSDEDNVTSVEEIIPSLDAVASAFVAANTHVFWDVDDFPIPCIRSLNSFPQNLKNALKFEGFVGDVSCWGYAAALTSYKAWCHFRGAGIMFVQEAEKKIRRLNRMLIDMVYWAYENPPRSGKEVNLLLIAKDIPDGETEFVSTVKALKRRNFNVFLVVSDDCPLEEMPIPPKNDYDLIWRWSNLLDGKIPIEIPFESDSDEDNVTSVEEIIPSLDDSNLDDIDIDLDDEVRKLEKVSIS